MDAQDKFPNNLLKRPWTERLEYFQERKIVHSKMESVTKDVLNAVRRRGGQGFIFVIGPTRIGKTTALEYVVNQLLEESMEDMLNDPGYIPVAWMETAPHHRGYDWKDHWVGCLEALSEPLIIYKQAYDNLSQHAERHTRAFLRESRTTTILRRSFEEASRQRKLRVFCVDEAQHLTLVPYSKMYRAQLEIIKSVASRSQAMHVLFGTYDLLKLRNASGQLGSRAVTIHFSRYRPDIKSDVEEFADAALSLAALMPLREQPDLSKDLDYCFDTCLGCIGLLKVWFSDALGEALENGERTLTRRMLEKNEPPIDVLDKISLEIIAGEQALSQDEDKRSIIRQRLCNGNGYKSGKADQSASAEDGAKTEQEKQDQIINSPLGAGKDRKGRNKGRRVERLPKRDKVGDGRNQLKD